MNGLCLCEFYGGPVDGLMLTVPDTLAEYRFAVMDALPIAAPIDPDEPPSLAVITHMVYRRVIGNPSRFEWVGYDER